VLLKCRLDIPSTIDDYIQIDVKPIISRDLLELRNRLCQWESKQPELIVYQIEMVELKGQKKKIDISIFEKAIPTFGYFKLIYFLLISM